MPERDYTLHALADPPGEVEARRDQPGWKARRGSAVVGAGQVPLDYRHPAARTQVDEAAEYGPLRLMTAVGRLVEMMQPWASEPTQVFLNGTLGSISPAVDTDWLRRLSLSSWPDDSAPARPSHHPVPCQNSLHVW